MSKKEKKKELQYRENPAVSNSSLGWLEVSPKNFVARVNKQIDEESTRSLDIGTLVHILALEPERVDEYAIVPEGLKFPSSAQQKAMCEAILEEGMDIEEGFRFYYPKHYSVKNKSEAAIEKAITELCKDLGPYIDFKFTAGDKTIVDHETFELATMCEHNLLEHKKSKELLFEGEEAYNELEIYFKYLAVTDDASFREIDCKSKIDRLVINHKKKEVYLIDLKTTSKMANKFYKSVEFYNYDRQLAFYEYAVSSYLAERNLEGYSIQCYFVVVETFGFNEVVVYRATNEVIDSGGEKYDALIKRFMFHLDNGFEYPMEYYQGDGSVDLILE